MVLLSENISDLTLFFGFAVYSNQNWPCLNRGDRWESHFPSRNGQQKTDNYILSVHLRESTFKYVWIPVINAAQAKNHGYQLDGFAWGPTSTTAPIEALLFL